MILKYIFSGVEEKHKYKQDGKSLFKKMIKLKYFILTEIDILKILD